LVSPSPPAGAIDRRFGSRPPHCAGLGPAGFGKTTWWSSGLHQQKKRQPLPLAWLSLDEWDNDITRFLNYLIAALQTEHGPWGQNALELLQSHQSTPAGSGMTDLINDLLALAASTPTVLCWMITTSLKIMIFIWP
jgi:ATP/maltotriose-dependent transcriptional regulator MalT